MYWDIIILLQSPYALKKKKQKSQKNPNILTDQDSAYSETE